MSDLNIFVQRANEEGQSTPELFVPTHGKKFKRDRRRVYPFDLLTNKEDRFIVLLDPRIRRKSPMRGIVFSRISSSAAAKNRGARKKFKVTSETSRMINKVGNKLLNREMIVVTRIR